MTISFELIEPTRRDTQGASRCEFKEPGSNQCVLLSQCRGLLETSSGRKTSGDPILSVVVPALKARGWRHESKASDDPGKR